MKIRFLALLIMLVTLVGCATKDAGPRADGAVIERNAGAAANWAAFHTFYDNAQNKRPDTINVVNYTMEGDPITIKVAFTGKHFKLTVDTRQDQFGPQEVRKITCGELSMQELPTGIAYEVSDCFGRAVAKKVQLLFEPKTL